MQTVDSTTDSYVAYEGRVSTVSRLTEGYGENAKTIGATVEVRCPIPTEEGTLERTFRMQLPLEAKPYPNVDDVCFIRFDW